MFAIDLVQMQRIEPAVGHKGHISSIWLIFIRKICVNAKHSWFLMTTLDVALIFTQNQNEYSYEIDSRWIDKLHVNA